MLIDTPIRGGLLVDGTGAPARGGELAIADGQIVGVGDLNTAVTAGTASRIIDATGLVVAPGFWDIHTHYDVQLLWDPLATSSSWHGVTTVVTGNCGFSPAPCRPEDQPWMTRTLARLEGGDVALDEDLDSHFHVLDSRNQDEAALLEILRSPHVIPGPPGR